MSGKEIHRSQFKNKTKKGKNKKMGRNKNLAKYDDYCKPLSLEWINKRRRSLGLCIVSP